MRQKKLASSKSKSHTCCYCGTQGHHFRECSIFRRDVSSHTRHPGCLDSSCEWIGPGHWRHGHKPIAGAPSVPQEPLSEPDACSVASEAPDVVISRDGARWCIINGHLHTPIAGVDAKDDPVMVAKYLASKANGPINVIWW